MPSIHTLLVITTVATLLAAGDAAAQPPPGPARTGPGYPQVYDPNMPFDPKEIAGIWTPNAVGFGGGGRCRDCGDRGFSEQFPVFTPEGQAAFEGPSREPSSTSSTSPFPTTMTRSGRSRPGRS